MEREIVRCSFCGRELEIIPGDSILVCLEGKSHLKAHIEGTNIPVVQDSKSLMEFFNFFGNDPDNVLERTFFAVNVFAEL